MNYDALGAAFEMRNPESLPVRIISRILLPGRLSLALRQIYKQKTKFEPKHGWEKITNILSPGIPWKGLREWLTRDSCGKIVNLLSLDILFQANGKV
jgi:hypothetical protein